jgi:hypothetical protein
MLLTAPLGLIGVSAGLLVFGQPFGFVAMLGTIALRHHQGNSISWSTRSNRTSRQARRGRPLSARRHAAPADRADRGRRGAR